MLFKNVIRTLKKQYIQLFLLGIIITLSSLIYTVMDYAMDGVIEPTEAYFEEANQEDFAVSMLDILTEDEFTYLFANCTVLGTLSPEQIPYSLSGLKEIDSSCYYNVMDQRITRIENTYDDINLELREAKDIYFQYQNETYHFRFLKETHVINKSYFVEGRAPLDDSEIAVAETFGKKNDLTIGDSITINEKDYEISGYVLFPDYSLNLISDAFIIDNKTQTIALVYDDEFESLNEYVSFELAGEFKNTMDDKTFENNVIDTYRDNDDLDYVTSIILTINNMRSGAIYSELSGGKAYTIFMSILVSSIGLMIVGIMVSKVLHNQRGPIGILKAMGYSNKQIAFPYILFIAILALPAIGLGYYIGYELSEPFKEMFMDFYLLPSRDIIQTPKTIIVSVIVPLVFILGLSYFITFRMLNQKPVILLNPEVTSSSNFLTKRVGKYLKKMKITSKLQHLLLYRNIVKFMVFLIGMGFAAYLILFSFSMNGIFDRMLFDYYENTNHEYIGYCDYFEPECAVGALDEEVIELPSAILEEEDIVLVGINVDTKLHPLLDAKGRHITDNLEDGLVISKSLSIIKGFKVGEILTLEVGDETIEIEISKITEEYNGNKAYIKRSVLSSMLTDNEDYYNTVYSENQLNEDDYLVVINTNDILEQADEMQGFFSAVVYLMVIISIVIAVIIVYILTVMTIEDNFYNISLFKVIGYNNKEIDKMIIGGYTLYGIIIFVIMIPIGIISFKFMELFLAQFYEMIMPLKFVWWHALISIIVYLTVFYIGAFVAKKKLEKVSLQEAMKMYQV